MKNKYFDELLAEGDLDAILDGDDEEPVPADPEEDAGMLRKTSAGVLLLILLLTVAETGLAALIPGRDGFSFGGLKLSCMLGLLVGGAGAAGLFLLMKKQIERILDLDAETAKKKLKLGAIFRMLTVILLVGLCFFLRFIHPAAVIIGLLNLKFAALLQPLLDKLLKKR